MTRHDSFLIDSFDRRITYLRLSVTDRCNLRCGYCMPQRNFSWLSHDSILTYEEILKICRAFAEAGIRKIRITGGEPLVRKGVPDFAARLNAIHGVEEICLTTNGVLLDKYAGELFDAGVKHLNISLDSLKPDRYAMITGRDMFHEAWKGIRKALETGFSPIKINSVIMDGVNDDELVSLAELALTYPLEVRFIEYMPVGRYSSWRPDRLVPCRLMKERVERIIGPLKAVPSHKFSGPAQIFEPPGARGKIGFISPLSNHFCGTCNRLRLTPEGKLRLCLFSDQEVDIRAALRQNVTRNQLKGLVRSAVRQKPEKIPAGRQGHPACERGMSTIGG